MEIMIVNQFASAVYSDRASKGKERGGGGKESKERLAAVSRL